MVRKVSPLILNLMSGYYLKGESFNTLDLMSGYHLKGESLNILDLMNDYHYDSYCRW